MHQLITLFLGFQLAVSASGQATAQALESFAPIGTSQAAYAGHWAGDGDEVPADADKGYPHHHAGCHDHGIGVEVTSERLPLHETIAQAPASNGTASLATADPASLLRPPRA